MPETLGPMQQLVMLATLRLGGDAYGTTIQDELQRVGRSVSISTIYVTMERLKRKGLVRSRLGDPTPIRGGKAKRLYELTAMGTRTLRAARDEMRQAWSGLERHPALSDR